MSADSVSLPRVAASSALRSCRATAQYENAPLHQLDILTILTLYHINRRVNKDYLFISIQLRSEPTTAITRRLLASAVLTSQRVFAVARRRA